MLPWHQYLFGLIFIIAGAFHFQKPKIYLRIMPPYLPAHSSLVMISGLAEMAFGFLLLNAETQSIAAWAIIVLLILFLTVHIHMLQDEKAGLKLPKWVLIVRIPVQFALMYWAYQYT